MTAATAAAVVVCLCGHVARLHPDDEHLCAIPGCGCTGFREYRPGMVTAEDAAALRALDAPRPVPTPRPAPAGNPPPAGAAPTGYACTVCGKRFDTKQGLGGHKSRAHRNTPPPPAAAPEPEPEPSPQTAAEPEQHVLSREDGNVIRCTARVHFDLPGAGSVDLEFNDTTITAFVEFLATVQRHAQAHP